jgi:stearoyl-CoA desaturase (delta-9 desaturase)
MILIHLWQRTLIKGYHNIKLLRAVQLLGWLSFPFVILFPQTFNLLGFLVGVFFITALGSSAGLHRYFGHKSFKTDRVRHWFLALVTTLSTQGSIALWVVYHRSHHVHSDTEEDPISPTFVGFWKAFFAIQDMDAYNIRPRHIVTELKDPAVKFFHDWYWPSIAVYVLILTAINPTLVLNMYLLPIFMVRFTFGLQNTFGHGYPKIDAYRNHDTKDNSVNSPFVNILTFCLGETLHNNHHANPGKYNYTEKWYELDLTGWAIKKFLANG